MINQAYSLLVNRKPDAANPAPWARYIEPGFSPVTLPDWLEQTRTLLVGKRTNWFDVTYMAEAILSVLYDPWRANTRSWLDKRVIECPVSPLTYYAEPVSILGISVADGVNATAQVDIRRASVGVPILEEWTVIYSGDNELTVKTAGYSSMKTVSLVNNRAVIATGISIAISGTPAVGDIWKVSAFTRPSNILGKVCASLSNIQRSLQLKLFQDNNTDYTVYEYDRIFRTSPDPADKIDAAASMYLYKAGKLS